MYVSKGNLQYLTTEVGLDDIDKNPYLDISELNIDIRYMSIYFFN